MSTKLVEVDPNPAEPRMVIWSTLRCLELQIDQHEELHNSTGVVSWGLLKQMLRLAKRHACEEGGAVIAAERETDQWRTRADEANAKLLETQQELQRLRAFVQLARGITPSVSFAEVEMLRAALAELDAGTIQPAPCPELERLRGKTRSSREICASGDRRALVRDADQLHVDSEVRYGAS